MTDLVPPEQLVMMTPKWRSTYGEHPVEIVDEKGRYWIAGSGRAAVFEPNGRFTLVRRDGTIDRGGPKTTFAPGHLVGAEHGLHSPSIRASRAEEVAEALFAEAPWVMDFDWPTIEVYCSAMARLRMFQEVAEAKARQLVEKEKLTPADAFFRIPAYLWSEMGATGELPPSSLRAPPASSIPRPHSELPPSSKRASNSRSASSLNL